MQPIIDALGPVLGQRAGLMLEIGSGTGQHAAACAAAFAGLDWQPSDAFDAHLDSVRAWVIHAGRANLRAPIWLDAAEPWPKLGKLAGVLSINVIHITPWLVARGIVEGAANALAQGGALIFYGPFSQGGQHISAGNRDFDVVLKSQDPAWGIRDIDDLAALAAASGFAPPTIVEMPSNNRLLVFSAP